MKGTLKRVMSGVLSVITIASAVAQPMTAYAAEPEKAASSFEAQYPELEAVKDKLAADEILTANDYSIDYGSDFDIKVDFSGIEGINDAKVKVELYEAKNEAGDDFDTYQADTYKTVYKVEPVSGNPSYRISRNVTVKEPETEQLTEPNTSENTVGEGNAGETEDSGNAEEDADAEGQTEIVTDLPEEEKVTTDEESGLTVSEVMDQAEDSGIDLYSMEEGEAVTFMAREASSRSTKKVTVTRGACYQYSDYGYGSYLTYKYTVKFGNVSATAYCIQPEKSSPGTGTYDITKLSDGKKLAKVCYYGTKAAGDEGFFTEENGYGNLSAGARFILVHLAASYANGGDSAFSGASSKDLQSRNERMFLVTALFLNTAETKQELENVVFQTAGIAQKYNCALKRLDYQQEQGLMSCLPLAMNLVPIKRALTTTSTAIFVPFTTQELFMGGESIYYGLNALSNNLIMADRKKLKNPNGLILGTPGAGKSFAAKREITNAFIVTKDDIIVCDPEGEYYPLFRAFHGQVIRISPTSHDYINPMDINLDYADDDDPLSLKSDFILSLCELVVGGKNGLEPVEKTVIDRCVRLVYQDFLSDPVPEKMPILEDLYNLLREQKEQEAQRLATALEIYVNGSLKVFNHRTNVELNNRMVCFDIKDLGKQLKKLGMLIVQDQVWNRVTINRSANKSTRYYIDEFHLLLKEEQTASYSVEIWKRFRKWGGIPTGITQNVKDLLASREIENIFENSDFILMLNQASGDRQILAKQLNISPHQLSYVTNSGEGEGLVFYGSTIIPFKDKFDNSLMLYALMTSKPDEVEKRKKLGIGERDD